MSVGGHPGTKASLGGIFFTKDPKLDFHLLPSHVGGFEKFRERKLCIISMCHGTGQM